MSAFSLMVAVCAAAWGAPEPALLFTTARTVDGTAVQSHGLRIDLESGETLSAPIALPGVVHGEAIVAEESGQVVCVAQLPKQAGIARDFGQARLVTLRDGGMSIGGDGVFPAGEDLSIAGAARTVLWDAETVFVTSPSSGGATVSAFTMREGTWWESSAGDVHLEGRVVDACIVPSLSVVLSLAVAGDEMVLSVRDPLAPSRIAHDVAIPEEPSQLAREAVGLATIAEGRFALVATTGYDVSDRDSARATWIRAYTLPDLAPVGDAVRVPGVVEGPGIRVAELRTGFWVGSFEPGTDFGRLAGFSIEDLRLREEASLSVLGVDRAPRAVVLPDARLAVAAGTRVEWRDGDGLLERSLSFDDPVEVLQTCGSGILVGEGPRLHRVDFVTREAVYTTAFDTGFVTDVAPLPGAMGAMTWPEPSPSFADVPWDVTFHGDAIVRELRSFLIEGDEGDGLRWRIAPVEAAPWLRVYPTEGRVPGRVAMAVDPAKFQPEPETVMSAPYRVELISGGGNVVATHPFSVRIAPPRAEVRRALWILSPDELGDGLRTGDIPSRYAPLVDRLAAAPFRMSHTVVESAAPRDLSGFTCVIATTAAAGLGRIDRGALLEYVWDGGAALVIASEAQGVEGPELPGAWLSPAGVWWEEPEPLGRVTPVAGDPSGIRTEGVALRAGRAMAVSGSPARALATVESGSVAVAAADYGLGRMVVVNGEDPCLAGHAGDVFVGDVVQWLIRSRFEIDDQDGDGLSDDVEDPNGNGALDPGETHHLKADTDGDGLPDGYEDANRNGRTDSGETSPSNADTDSDGIPDGADSAPLPALDAPRIERVAPSEAPAQGGTRVTVSGANLGPTTDVWFGDRRARNVVYRDPDQLDVDLPSWPDVDGALVDVRVALPEREAVLANGFRYAPADRLRLAFDGLRAIETQYSVYSSTLYLSMESGAPVRGGYLDIEIDPPGAVSAADVRVAEGDVARTDAQLLSSTLLRVPFATEDASGLQAFSLEISLDVAFPDRVPRLRFALREGRALPLLGAPLVAEGTPRAFDLRSPTP